jgi:hypothetical protein
MWAKNCNHLIEFVVEGNGENVAKALLFNSLWLSNMWYRIRVLPLHVNGPRRSKTLSANLSLPFFPFLSFLYHLKAKMCTPKSSGALSLVGHSTRSLDLPSNSLFWDPHIFRFATSVLRALLQWKTKPAFIEPLLFIAAVAKVHFKCRDFFSLLHILEAGASFPWLAVPSSISLSLVTIMQLPIYWYLLPNLHTVLLIVPYRPLRYIRLSYSILVPWNCPLATSLNDIASNTCFRQWC